MRCSSTSRFQGTHRSNATLGLNPSTSTERDSGKRPVWSIISTSACSPARARPASGSALICANSEPLDAPNVATTGARSRRREEEAESGSSAAEKEILRKGLPSNLDAERSVLGAILLDNSAYNYAAELLIADDFSSVGHRRIFARMVALRESGRPIDPVTLTEELLRTDELETAGGVTYLSALTEGLPRATNVAHYAGIVREKAQFRRIIHLTYSAMHEAFDGHEKAGDICQRLTEALDAVGGVAGNAGPQTVAEIFRVCYGSLDSLVARGRRRPGVPTGFLELDRLTGGLQDGNLVLLAARPSMGETACALNVAAHVACNLGWPVLLFSIEMSR